MSNAAAGPAHGLGHTRPVPAGHHGQPGTAGVVARWCQDLALATLSARRQGDAALSVAIEAAFGAPLPAGPRAVQAGGITFIGTAPGRWLAATQDRPTLAADLTAAAGAHGAVTEQSDAYAVLDLSGPRVRDALAKLLAVDLDPSVFGPGDVAVSTMAHIGAVLWQTSDNPEYRVLVGASLKVSFAHALLPAAAEYGLDLADEDAASRAGRGIEGGRA